MKVLFYIRMIQYKKNNKDTFLSTFLKGFQPCQHLLRLLNISRQTSRNQITHLFRKLVIINLKILFKHYKSLIRDKIDLINPSLICGMSLIYFSSIKVLLP
ncbi:hypothetical protein NBO_18g0023 [Nosema bombycis CQ1]|uniref:Uncharacterized protein n=1 Tax=Nosema bombycis (strain CQ1 / CVCC 102059) TaxID=578461 RepID=R0KUZ1_NOSB1|nr:hypothetical protein NBO_18g0023 [Nosema bombycis CQ1]|eukprot:EOB14696.1 hypothetical protein NBO_18g0023 [Nosema bombycis CQ1]